MSRIGLNDHCFWFLSLVILAMLWELSGPAAAQPRGFPGGGRRPMGSGTPERLAYNPQTVTTVKGQVQSLGSYGMTGWRVAPGMQIQGLVLATDKGTMTINLGPPSWVSKQGFHLKQGDSLEVTGSKVTRDDQTVLLASQVKKDEQTLKVRDEKGAPLWQEQDRGGRGSSGMGRGGMGSGGRSPGGRGAFTW